MKEIKFPTWEAWEADAQIVIHWGELGERGQSQIIPLTAGELAESRIAQEAKKYHEEGYRQLKEGEPVTVLVQYEFDGWGTPADSNGLSEGVRVLVRVICTPFER